MGQNFVDDNGPSAATNRIGYAGRTTYPVAGSPGARITFSVTWPGKHEGRTGSVRSNGPRIFCLILNLEENGVLTIPQSDGAAVIRKRAVKRPQNIGAKAVGALNQSGVFCHYNETASRNDRVRWESVIDIAGKPIAANPFPKTLRIVD